MADSSDSTTNRLLELRQRWEREPDSRIYLQLADELRRVGQIDEAIAVLEKGLERRPNDLSGMVSLGRCRLEVGAIEGAVESLETVTGRDPAHLVANKLLIEAHLQREDAEQAEQRLELYRLLNDRDPELDHLEYRLQRLRSRGSTGVENVAAEPTIEPAPVVEPILSASAEATVLEDAVQDEPEEAKHDTHPSKQAVDQGVVFDLGPAPPRVEWAALWDEALAARSAATSEPEPEAEVETSSQSISPPPTPPPALAADEPFGTLAPATPEASSIDLETLLGMESEQESAAPALPATEVMPAPPEALFEDEPEVAAAVMGSPAEVAREGEGEKMDSAAAVAPTLEPVPEPEPLQIADPELPQPVDPEPPQPADPEPPQAADPEPPQAAEPELPQATEPTVVPSAEVELAAEPEFEVAAAVSLPDEPAAPLSASAAEVAEEPEVVATEEAATSTLGEIYLQQGHVGEAERIFRRVLAQQPNDVAARAGMAKIAVARGDKPRELSAAELLTSSGGGQAPPEGVTAKKIVVLKGYLNRIRSNRKGASL